MKSFANRTGTPVRLNDDQFYLSLLAFLSICAAAAVSWMALLLHRNFLTIACDTAEFQNAIVNTLSGHWFRDTVIDGPNLLGMHALFIFLLLVPVYTVLPYPEVLFGVQICAVYATVLVIYVLARSFTTNPLLAFFVAGSALFSPMLAQMAFAPFHPETWVAAAVFATYYFYRRQKPLAFALCFAVGLTSGEMAAFIFLSLGLALLLGEDKSAWRSRYGAWLIGISLAWLVLSLLVISPAVRVPEQQNLFGYHYAQWKISSASGLLLAALQNPVMALETLFHPSRWLYLLLLIGPLLFFVLTSRTALIILFVSFPIYFLMDDQEFYLYFHAYYYSYAFIAAYIGFLFYLERKPADRPVAAFLSSTYCLTILLLFYSMSFYFRLLGGVDEPFSTSIHEAFAQIPLNAAIYGPHRYSAYLSNRPNMVMGDIGMTADDFDTMVEKKYPTTNVHADQIDYIVADYWTDQCGWRRAYWNEEQYRARAEGVNRLVTSGKWKIVWQQNDVVILQRVKTQ